MFSSYYNCTAKKKKKDIKTFFTLESKFQSEIQKTETTWKSGI